jgi:hypothetical protein
VEPENEIVAKVIASAGVTTTESSHSSPTSLSSGSGTIGLPRIAEERDSPKDDHGGESHSASSSLAGTKMSMKSSETSISCNNPGVECRIGEKFKLESKLVTADSSKGKQQETVPVCDDNGASSVLSKAKPIAKSSPMPTKSDEKLKLLMGKQLPQSAADNLNMKVLPGPSAKLSSSSTVPAPSKDLTTKKPKESVPIGSKFAKSDKKSP